MLQNGDYMYLYNEKTTYMIPYQKNGSFSSHKGNIKFTEGLEYGDTVYTNTGEIFHVLKPSIADYMMKVKRRTTIIYPKEAGAIIMELGIGAGKKVVEIGSGSGSLTILLSSLIGPEGKLYSFERKAEHQEFAIANSKKFGFNSNVEFILKDPVVEGGFGLTGIEAMFVDVPAPWTLIEHAHKALENGGHIGFLSPNIEQIQATAYKMEEVGFARIRCMELLSRGIRIKKNLTRPHDRMIGHTGYLLFAQKIKNPVNNRESDYHI